MPEASTVDVRRSSLGRGPGRASEPQMRKAAMPATTNSPGIHPRMSALCGRAPQHALVADAAREAVGVEALEQELRRPPADAEQIAKPRERDPARRLAFVYERRP